MSTKSAYAILWTLWICLVGSGAMAQDSVKYNVYLRSNYGTDTMHDGRSFRIYGMTHRLMDAPTIPAPPIFCNQGDTVILNAVSISQKDHHTIHLHGLDVDTRNDGDPATSFYLSHLEDTTYSFRAHHAGTYIYHCHVADVSHVQMGMYGLVIVRAAGGKKEVFTGGPEYSQEYNWITSEIDPAWHDSVPVHDDSADVVYIPRYDPQYFLINGKSEWELAQDSGIHIRAKAYEPVLIRLANIGFYHNRLIIPEELEAVVYEADGRAIPVPWESDTLDLSPGERLGILMHPKAQGEFHLKLRFESMNTPSIFNVQEIPVQIQGVFGLERKEATVQLTSYPNPARDLLYVEAAGIALVEHLDLVNSVGVVHPVRSVGSGSGILQLDISSLTRGLYTVRVPFRDGQIHSTRVLIDR